MDTVVTLAPSTADARYDADFVAWTQDQGRKLRDGRFDALDLANLAEEIESMGRAEKRELSNRLTVLLTHLLKWAVQPSRQGRSWIATIREQRVQSARILRENPSLRPQLPDIFTEAYAVGRIRAYGETELPETAFPDTCPWTWGQVLEQGFFPDPISSP